MLSMAKLIIFVIFKEHFDEKYKKIGAVHFINTGFTEGSQMNALRELCVQASSHSLSILIPFKIPET